MVTQAASGGFWVVQRAMGPVAMRGNHRTAAVARAVEAAAEVAWAAAEATGAAVGLAAATAGHGAHTLSARPA